MVGFNVVYFLVLFDIVEKIIYFMENSIELLII